MTLDLNLNIIVPIVTAVAGFCLKLFIDYKWLKAPRISMAQKISFDRHVPAAQKSNSEFSYTLYLQASNHSANDAYGYKITSIEGPVKMNFKFYIRVPTKPVTIRSGETSLIRIKFAFQDVEENFFSYNLSNQFFLSHFGNSTYVINYEYTNSFGKKYKLSRQYGFSNDFEENMI